MSVHYKFKSALEYDTVTFDGLHISVKDLKKAIIHQKRIGKTTDFDLQVTNAQTKEVYNDENALIPKNTSLVIARVPLAAQTKGKPWEGYGTQGQQAAAGSARPEDGAHCKAVDLTQLDASEDDKIRAMMTQSTLDYDPSNYMKIRGSNQVGVVPTHYRCYKCHQQGHWIKDCPLGHGQESMEIKKSTGIPRSFMVPVEGPMVPGAMMTPTGQYAVPALDHQAYNEGPKVTAPAQEEKPEIPEDLLCTICKDLLTDAVMIPCCGNSFCDECVRTVLLESEDHECPDCHEKDISPGTLIPNRFLRNSVSNFKNETGYHKRQQYRNATITSQVVAPQEPIVEIKIAPQEPVIHPAESTTAEIKPASPALKQEIKTDSQTPEEPDRSTDSQKPIISEADSTETTKTANSVKEEVVPEKPPLRVSPPKEGPPGVEEPPEKPPVNTSEAPPGVDVPNHASQGQAITSVGSAVNHHRVMHHASLGNSNSRNIPNHDRHYPPPVVSNYNDHNSRPVEERPGTPTVDEPGIGPPGYSGSDPIYGDAPPGLHPTTTTLPPPQHLHLPPQIQGPPPLQQQQQQQQMPGPYALPPNAAQPPPGHFPPTSAPPPSGFRLPPPGHPDYNRVFPPRPVFDPTRPPVPFDPLRPPHGAPPPGYPPFPMGVRPPGRYPPPRHLQPPPPGMIRGPPPTVIDDPLEAFNRMLREKDERDRRARQRRVTRSRSYSRSRSSSRSFSRSPRSRSRSPPPRNRHRSRTRSPPPRNRRTPRSRSRSFSISRSRSFSRSPSFRGSPVREYSPRRRPPSRYRSPMNRPTPPRYRYKDNRPMMDRDRDRDRMDRDRDRLERDRNDRDRDYQYYDGPQAAGGSGGDYPYENNFERPRQQRGPGPGPPNRRYGGPPRKDYPLNEPYYQPPDMCPPTNYPPHNNRFNSRGGGNYPPPLMGMKAIPPHVPIERAEPLPPPSSHRKYDDIAPPGIEQPPVPGFENQRYEARFPPYERSRGDDGPPGVDRFQKASPYPEREREREQAEIAPTRPDARDYRDRPPGIRDNADNKFDRKYSPSPERRHKSVSPRRSSRDRNTSTDRDKSSRRRSRRDESADRDKRPTETRLESDKKEKKKETSEDEKSRKNKDKKKKKEKKEAERKKKKERKEKKEQEKLKKAEEKKAKEVQDPKEEQPPTKKEEPSKDETKLEVKQQTIKLVKLQEEPVKMEEIKPPKVDLYDDILSEGIDNTVVENYGKIDQMKKEDILSPPPSVFTKEINEETPKHHADDDEEKEASFDGIELQANEAELKLLETKSKEMLAPLPEPSKWEIDEETSTTPEKPHPSEGKLESKQIFERPNKIVTSEVIKRAENALFSKAINAIRPIEIKKISLDRAKLYSGEKEKPTSSSSSTESVSKEAVKNIQITIPGSGWNLDDIPPPGTEPIKLKTDRSKVSPPPSRLSVKERLGCKVEELDRITKDDRLERNRSRTLSPLSKRAEEGSRNVSLAERRVEVDDRRREDYRRPDRHRYEHDRDRRQHRNERSRSRENKTNFRDRRTERKDYRSRDDNRRQERSRSRHRNERRHDHREEKPRDQENRDRERKRSSRERRSKSRSESKDRKDRKKKPKEKRHKKEKEKEKDKGRRHKKEDEADAEQPKAEVKVESKIISDKKEEIMEKIAAKIEKAKPLDDRRKPTLDEANFEPDYDLETESEKEDHKSKLESSKKRERTKSPEKTITIEIPIKKRRTEEIEKKPQIESSSSDSSDSSSDEKHKKKHKKHKKKKSKKDTSSSSDSSDSDSSVERKSKKRHKSSKKLKKKKKSKHK